MAGVFAHQEAIEGFGPELIEMVHLGGDRGRLCQGSTCSFKSLAA